MTTRDPPFGAPIPVPGWPWMPRPSWMICVRLAGYWVPAAQVPDGLAVLPLDGVYEQVGQPPPGGDAGDAGGPAAGPDRDDRSCSGCAVMTGPG